MNIALVPARSGSKRIPNKNIRSLNGKPLVYWTLKAFLDSEKFDKVFFSTDSQLYIKTVMECISDERLCFHRRSEADAGDSVKIFDYIKGNYRDFACDRDLFAMGLPTAPMRNANHIAEACNMATALSAPVFSACQYSFPVSFAFTLPTEKPNFPLRPASTWEPLLPSRSPMITGNTRSQDQVPCYHPNGAIYVIPDIASIERMDTFYSDSVPYIMDLSESVDIDHETDFLYAEQLMRVGAAE